MTDVTRLEVQIDGRAAKLEAVSTGRALNKLQRDATGLAASTGTASAGLTKQAASTQVLGASSARAAVGVGALGVSLRGLVVSAAAFAGIAVGLSALRAGVRSATQFSLAIAEVGTLVDDSFGSLQNLREETIRLARTFGTTSTEQAGALYNVISAGADNATDAVELLTQANILALAGVTNVGVATNLLTGVLNAYGLGTSEASRINDVFFVGVREGRITIEEFGATFGQIAPILAGFGVSAEEGAASISFLTKNGIAATQATTGLRALLVSIAAPSDQARKLADANGIAWSAASLRANGLTDTLRDAFNALGQNEEAFRRLIGSTEALSPALVFARDDSNDFNRILDATKNSLGAAAAAADEVAESLGQRLKEAQAGISEQFQIFGARILPSVVTGLKTVNDNLGLIVGTISVLFGALALNLAGNVLLASFALANRVLGRTAKGVAVASGAVGTLGTTAGKSAFSLTRLGTALGPALFNPIGLTVAALGAATIGIIALNSDTKNLAEDTEDFTRILKEGGTAWEIWGGAATDALRKVASSFGNPLDPIRGFVFSQQLGAQEVRRGISDGSQAEASRGRGRFNPFGSTDVLEDIRINNEFDDEATRARNAVNEDNFRRSEGIRLALVSRQTTARNQANARIGAFREERIININGREVRGLGERDRIQSSRAGESIFGRQRPATRRNPFSPGTNIYRAGDPLLDNNTSEAEREEFRANRRRPGNVAFEGGARALRSLLSPLEREVSDLRRQITIVRNNPFIGEADRSERLAPLNNSLMDLLEPPTAPTAPTGPSASSLEALELIRQTRTAEESERARLQDQLVRAQENTDLTGAQQADVILRTQAALDELNTTLEEPGPFQTYLSGLDNLTDAFQTLKISGVQSLSDTLSDFVLKGKLDLDSFADVLRNVAQQILSLSIQRSIVGPLASLLPFADGGVIQNGNVLAFASGGVVDSPTFFSANGRPAVAGEAGPEAIIPLSRGRDGRLGVSSSGSGGNNFNSSVVINVEGNVDSPETLESIGRTVKTVVRSELVKYDIEQSRSGGSRR